MPEPIPIGADHAGFQMKERLKAELERMGYAVEDLGAYSAEPSDYPDYAHRVAEKIEKGEASRGVLLCGTGLGMGVAANRHPGVRAAVVWSPEVARLSRQHNDANVLILPARCLEGGEEEGVEILKTWLETPIRRSRR